MFNKKLKQEIAVLRKTHVEDLERIIDLEERVGAYSNKALAEKLFESAYDEVSTHTFFSQRGMDRVKVLASTIRQLNYRDYIVRTARGRLCVDPQQLQLSDEEVTAWVARIDMRKRICDRRIAERTCEWCSRADYADLVAYIPNNDTGGSDTPPHRCCIVCGRSLEA